MRRPVNGIRKIDFAHRGAGLGERRCGAFDRGLGFRLRAVPHLGAAQADPRRRIHRARRLRRLHAQHGGEQLDVVERAREPADGVDAFRRRLHAGFVEAVVGRLEAEDAAIGTSAAAPSRRSACRAPPAPCGRRPPRPSRSTSRPACARDCADWWSPAAPCRRIRRSRSCPGSPRRRGATAPRKPHPTAADGPCRSASPTRSACRTYR